MHARTTFRLALGLVLLALGSADLSAQVSINRTFCSGSFCPQPLVLIPGTPTTVNLRGRRLGQLQAGAVIDRGGFPTRGVTVTLGRNRRRGTRRDVTLTATGGPVAQKGFELQFTLRAGGTAKAPLQLSVAALTVTGITTGVVQQPAAPPSPGVTNEPLTAPTVSVSSASPSSIDLEPGKPGKIVTLTGSLLDRATGARIEWSPRSLSQQRRGGLGLYMGSEGEPVDNVMAELLPASGPSQRDLRLTAQAGYDGIFNIRLELRVALSGPGATDATAPVGVQVGLANLRIGFGPSTSGSVNLVDPRTVVLLVINGGKAAAVFPPQSDIAHLSDNTGSLDEYLVSAGSGLVLGPGESWETTLEFPAPTFNDPLALSLFTAVYYEGVVDPGRVVRESNETDNSAELAVDFTPQAPDPINVDVVLQQIETVPNAALNEGYEFRLTIFNAGQDASSSVSVSRGECSVGGLPLREPLAGDIYGLVSVGSIGPNETRVVTMRPGGWLSRAGTYTCSYSAGSAMPSGVGPLAGDYDHSNNSIDYTWTVNPD